MTAVTDYYRLETTFPCYFKGQNHAKYNSHSLLAELRFNSVIAEITEALSMGTSHYISKARRNLFVLDRSFAPTLFIVY